MSLDIAGPRAVSCSLTGSAKVWEIESGRPVAELVGHAGDVMSCHLSPDGKLAATGSSDGTARIWDPETGDMLAVVRGPGVEVRAVGFAGDGARLVIGGDGGAAIWDLPRFTGDLDRLLRCRVPYTVSGDRLIAHPRDLAACGGL
jgi:hypothetical protein